MSKKLLSQSANSPSTDRARAFRDRLEQTSLTRWEIFVTEVTKSRVREIARLENLTAGVAAEALLELGVEAYVAGMASSPSASVGKSASTTCKLATESRDVLEPMSSKPLGAYSSRSGPSGSYSTGQREQAAPLRAFFARAKSKGT